MSTSGKTLKFRAAKLKGFTVFNRSCNIPLLQSQTVKVNQRRNSINSDQLKAPTT